MSNNRNKWKQKDTVGGASTEQPAVQEPPVGDRVTQSRQKEKQDTSRNVPVPGKLVSLPLISC